MKVKCIKDTIGFNKGEIYETNLHSFLIIGNPNYIPMSECVERYPEYFQEVKEEEVKKPKWKVGDYVVYSYKKYPPSYIKIHTIVNTSGGWCYNDIGGDDLRDPTLEELKIYFR